MNWTSGGPVLKFQKIRTGWPHPGALLETLKLLNKKKGIWVISSREVVELKFCMGMQEESMGVRKNLSKMHGSKIWLNMHKASKDDYQNLREMEWNKRAFVFKIFVPSSYTSLGAKKSKLFIGCKHFRLHNQKIYFKLCKLKFKNVFQIT